jgi:hypothetical protein
VQSSIKFDDRVLKKKIHILLSRLKVDQKEFITDQTSFLARDLAKYVPPYAQFPSLKSNSIGKAADKKAGEKAILSDLNRIFFVPDDASVYTWARKEFPSGRVYTKGRISGLGVATSIEEMARHHMRFRNPVTGRIGRVSVENRLWVSKRLFNRYYKDQKVKVGYSKAGFASVAMRLNSKVKVPAWVKRHVGRANSSYNIKTGKNEAYGRFKSVSVGVRAVSSKTVNMVTKRRYESMEQQLSKMFKDIAKRAGWKVRIR